MRDDCRKVAKVGKNISAALHDYHADCFRISNGGANCSLKLLLGGAWDELLSTPFVWAGVGFQACESREGQNSTQRQNYTLNKVLECAFCSEPASLGMNGGMPICATPALVRLTVCPSQVWWPDAITAAMDVMRTCQSSEACSSLCYGHKDWNNTKTKVRELTFYSLTSWSRLSFGIAEVRVPARQSVLW